MIRRLDTAPAELETIHAQCFDHGWSTGVFTDLIVKPHHRIYALFTADAIASFIALSVVAGEGEILTLATDPAQQKRGHARALLDHVIAALREEGIEALFLEVAVDNDAALALYRACGFVRAGLRKAYYSRKSGVPVDGYILRLALS